MVARLEVIFAVVCREPSLCQYLPLIASSRKSYLSIFINQTLVESLLLSDHGDVSCWDDARDRSGKGLSFHY